MGSIRSKNTRPELMIRKLVWKSGKRYRLHDRSILGTPDISSKAKKVAIFIDGCFWHGCKRCYKEPSTNVIFWRQKISTNIERRRLVVKRLKKEKWTILQFWEHSINEKPSEIANLVIQIL